MKFFILMSLLFFSISSVYSRIHKVQGNEYLSTIATKYFLDKPYGSKGGVAYLKKINPQFKDSDEVIPGEFIALDEIGAKNLRRKYQLETKNGLSRYFSLKPEKTKKAYPIFEDINSYERDKHELFFAPIFGSIKMVAKEGAAVENVDSDFGKGFQIGFMQNWMHGLASFIKYGLITYSFETSGNRILVNKTRIAGFLESGFDFRYAERHGFEINAGMKDYLVFQSQNIINPEIKKIRVPYSSIISKHHIVKTKGASLGPEFIYMMTLNGKGEGLKSNNSNFYGAKIHLDTRAHWGRFVTKVSYLKGELATTHSKQEMTELGLEINFHINI